MINQVNIDINYECNLDCEFCYSKVGGELSYTTLEKIAADCGGARLFEVGGGEPFLHKNFLDFIHMLTDKEKQVHISTNATYVPERFLEMPGKNLVTVQVSLHAATPEAYMSITRKDKFHTVVENVKRIKPHYTTLISSAIYKKNLHEIEGLVELSDNLGLPLRVNLSLPTGNGRYVENLSSEEITDLRDYLFREKVLGRDIDSPLLHPNNCPAITEAYGIKLEGSCPAQDDTKVYIDPSGGKHRCEFWSPQENPVNLVTLEQAGSLRGRP